MRFRHVVETSTTSGGFAPFPSRPRRRKARRSGSRGRLASKMVSARTYCPQCNRRHVLHLNEVFYSPNVDFFRCENCRYIWHVDKDKDGPASRTLLGESNTPERQNTTKRIGK